MKVEAEHITQEFLEEILKRNFGYSSFRPGQYEVISSILRGKDTFVIQSTGGGKSLCYQLPSLVLYGLTLVISPLISLMEDQVREARKFGRKDVASIHSGLTAAERAFILQRLGQFKLLYISPEGIQNPQVLHALQRRRVSLFVVDEAHCISQWGHDFRLDYLKLAEVRAQLNNPPCLALTATATEQVKKDIIHYLQLDNFHSYYYSVDRPNISMLVHRVEDEKEKNERIISFLEHRKDAGMIYFSSRAKAESFTQLLLERGVQDVAYYHGGLSSIERNMIQQQFLAGELRIICATNAFGMGVNKQDIRYVIHYHFPSQIESYVQEMGRCSRDGRPGLSYVFIQEGDEQIPYHFLEQELLNQAQVQELVTYLQYCYTHRQAFRLDDLAFRLGCSTQALQIAIHHLQELGIIPASSDNEKNELLPPLIIPIGLEQTIYHRMELLRNNKSKKIADMYYWTLLQEGSCRREYILHYFSEKNDENKANPCCDLCGIPSDWIHRDIGSSNYRVRRNGSSWQEKLSLLWPINGEDM